MLNIAKVTLAYSNKVNFAVLIEEAVRDVVRRVAFIRGLQ